MFRWAIIFLVVAVLAAVLGISGLSQEASQVAKALAVIGLILAIGSLLFNRRSRTGRGRFRS